MTRRGRRGAMAQRVCAIEGCEQWAKGGVAALSGACAERGGESGQTGIEGFGAGAVEAERDCGSDAATPGGDAVQPEGGIGAVCGAVFTGAEGAGGGAAAEYGAGGGVGECAVGVVSGVDGDRRSERD